jgi:hypothetical protein
MWIDLDWYGLREILICIIFFSAQSTLIPCNRTRPKLEKVHPQIHSPHLTKNFQKQNMQKTTLDLPFSHASYRDEHAGIPQKKNKPDKVLKGIQRASAE